MSSCLILLHGSGTPGWNGTSEDNNEWQQRLEEGENNCWKISIFFNVQNADYFGEEINLCWLLGNQFVDHTALGEFCCIFNSLTWVAPIKQNFTLFTSVPDGRKCKQLSKWWWSLFFHILACHYVRDILYQQIKTSKT